MLESVPPSVGLTLVDCDQIGWNSSEIISPLVSLGCSLSADPHQGSTPRGTPEILAQSDPPPESQISAEWLQNTYSATVTMESL